MRHLVLHAGFMSEYSALLLSSAESGVDRIRAYCRSLCCDEVHILGSPGKNADLPADYHIHDTVPATQKELVGLLQRILRGEQGTIVYSYFDYPFLSVPLSEELLALHRKQYCEYSFADAYPEGMTPEILESSTLEVLASLSTDEPLSRQALFDIVSKDINAFDVETKVADYDYRMLRCVLSTQNERDFLLCKRLAERGGFESDEIVLSLLRDERQILRTLPSYFLIQLTDTHVAPAYYEPECVKGDSAKTWMDAENFAKLFAMLKDFAPHAQVEVGYRGEPALHPQFSEILDVLSRTHATVYLQTTGQGWSKAHIDEALAALSPRLYLIFSLDAVDPDSYRAIRGAKSEEAYSTAETFLSAAPEQVYVQLTRIDEFEREVEAFYRYWKEKTEHIIIQKHNDYCGAVPRRKVVDLSPLSRFPCWQLERDMTILLDGSVPFCAQDYRGTACHGNVFSECLEAVWERGAAHFASHVNKEYPSLCRNCDEYYIFHS